ncbi:MAG: hypothetical protein ACTSVF_01085 [Candidatus Asgardarchaeia archaeon]
MSIVEKRLLKKYKGKKVLSRRGFRSKVYGVVDSVVKTKIGSFLTLKSKDGVYYIPESFIDRTIEEKVILKEGLEPFREKIWETITQKVPHVEGAPIGIIEEVRTVKGIPCLAIKLELAPPIVVKEIWKKMSTKTKYENYFLFAEKEFGIPFPLSLHPKVVAYLAKKLGINVPDRLFMTKMLTPLPDLKNVEGDKIRLSMDLNILKEEVKVPENIYPNPKPLRYTIEEDLEKLKDRLYSELRERKKRKEILDLKVEENSILVYLRRWLTCRLLFQSSDGMKSLSLSFDVDWSAFEKIKKMKLRHYVGFIFIGSYIIKKKERELEMEINEVLNYMKDPSNYESVKKFTSLVNELLNVQTSTHGGRSYDE